MQSLFIQQPHSPASMRSPSTELENHGCPLSATLGEFVEHLPCCTDPTTLGWAGCSLRGCREPNAFLWLCWCQVLTEAGRFQTPAGLGGATCGAKAWRRLSAPPCWQHPVSIPLGKQVFPMGLAAGQVGPGEVPLFTVHVCTPPNAQPAAGPSSHFTDEEGEAQRSRWLLKFTHLSRSHVTPQPVFSQPLEGPSPLEAWEGLRGLQCSALSLSRRGTDAEGGTCQGHFARCQHAARLAPGKLHVSEFFQAPPQPFPIPGLGPPGLHVHTITQVTTDA